MKLRPVRFPGIPIAMFRIIHVPPYLPLLHLQTQFSPGALKGKFPDELCGEKRDLCGHHNALAPGFQ